MNINQEISEHASEEQSQRPSQLEECYPRLHNNYDELESSRVDEEEEAMDAIDAMPPKRAPTPLIDNEGDDEAPALPGESDQSESRQRNRPMLASQSQEVHEKRRRKLQQKTSIMQVYNLEEDEEKIQTKIIHQSTVARPALFLREDPHQHIGKKSSGANSMGTTTPSYLKTEEDLMENRSSLRLFKKSQVETTTVQLNGLQSKKEPLEALVEPVPAPKTHMKEHHQKKFQGNLKLSRGLMKRDSKEDIYDFFYPAPDPRDSGIKVDGTLPSFRDDISTRTILATDLRARRKLAPLAPYKAAALSDSKDELAEPQQLPEALSCKEQTEQNPIIFSKFRQGRAVIPDEAITDALAFIRCPIVHGQLLECNLRRNKTCSKRFFLDFDLTTEQGKFLMSVKKMPFKCVSTYHLSLLNGDYQPNSQAFLGKVQGNFSGSEFNIYQVTQGQFAEKGVAQGHSAEELVATIVYNSNCFCCDIMARQVEVYIKDSSVSYFQIGGTKLKSGANLKELYQVESNRKEGRIRQLVSKQPKWNPETSGYSMNFHGRAKYSSVKNMILLEEGRKGREALLMAKQGDNDFALDVGHPLSPMVALGIVITGFDFKLATQ